MTFSSSLRLRAARIISYLFLFILLVPPGIKGAVTVFLLFLAFAVLTERNYGSSTAHCSHHRSAQIAAAAADLLLILAFRNRWDNKYRSISSLAGLFHLSVPVFLALAAIPLAVLGYYALQRLFLFAGCTVRRKAGEDAHTDKNRGNSLALILLCLVSAVGVIAVCSESSFLYPFNDWNDANAYYTVGRALMQGYVPYRDLFDHKGPLLYFLHGAAWLVSNTSFLGMYLWEVAAAFFFLYFSGRILLLYSDRRILPLIPVLALAVYTAFAFAQGDSTEELCLPFLAYALFLSLRSHRTGIPISPLQYFLTGLTAGCVFWTKFTLTGLYLGWFLPQAAEWLRQHKIKSLLTSFALILAGVFVSTVPWLIYFAAHHAISDWLEVYLYHNLFTYSSSASGAVSGGALTRLFYGFRNFQTRFPAGMLLFALSGAFFFLRNERRTGFHLLCMLISAYVFVYIGGQAFDYYSFILAVFSPLGLLLIWELISDSLPERFLRRSVPAMLAAVAVCVPLALFYTPNNYLLKYSREELPQFRFAAIIHETENPTLLNYGALDGGFYTAADIIPSCKAFFRMGSAIPEMYELQDHYLEEGLCDYVVLCNSTMELEHYDLVSRETMETRDRPVTWYLYRHK